jgi:DNA-binding NtrC family response regulator
MSHSGCTSPVSSAGTLSAVRPLAIAPRRSTTRRTEVLRCGALIGASPAMEKVFQQVARVAPTEATVLILGESGTGKELVAEAVHRLSGRSDREMLAVNCGAISANLIESELFGHERGSFTGADRAHRGHFERADGGTLFLDEICEMPKELQVKLLRVLESGTFTRVGGDRTIRVNVRIIAAAKDDLERAAAEGRFRADLLYRLKVFPILLPPLRERAGDLALLANHFIAALNLTGDTDKCLTAAAFDELRAHAWPGNVRELKHALERAYILSEEAIDGEFLSGLDGKVPAPERAASPVAQRIAIAPGMPLAEAERHFILATLDLVEGSKTKAAELLQISTKTLYGRLREYRASGHWVRAQEEAEPASALRA